MLIAQLSDTHVRIDGPPTDGRPDPNARLDAAVARLLDQQPAPDLVLVTGDLTEHGAAEEYAALRRILGPLPMPVYVIPGNHDVREALRAAFAGDGYLPDDGEFLHYTVEDWPVRLVCLDDTVAGEPQGELCAARVDWLAARLAEDRERPTMVCLHHPPVDTGMAAMDEQRLQDADRLARVVAAAPNVVRVLAGHLHRPVHSGFAGTTLSVCPSTAFHLAADLRPGAPNVLSPGEPGAFQLHAWIAGQGLVTHLVSF